MKSRNFHYQLKLVVSTFLFVATPFISTAQTVIAENFDGVTGGYPTTTLPRGWSQGKYGVSSNPINQWELLNGASTANPAVTPPSASNCIRFQSFAIPANESTFIASKRLDMRAIPAGGAALSFKLYRNNQYPANTDNIQVFVNDSATVTPGSTSQLLLTETGSGLTAINRSISLSPVVAANGWYTYNYIIPNTYNTANVYVCIVGTSAFGDNMYIDDFSVTTYPNAQNYVASSANIFSQNTSTTQAGAVSQEIIGIKVTMDGLTTPRTMTEFIINTNGTTNPNTDLLNAKLYWTGGTPQFSLQNSVLLGTSNNPNVTNDTFLVANPVGCCLTGPVNFATLDHGDNYFWVAYDLKPGATSGNFVDAEFVSVRITPNATPITGTTSSLPGNRLIDVVYCQPSYSVGTSWAGYQTNDYIHGVTLVGNNSPVGGINMTNSVNTIYAAAGPLCGGTAYPRRCPFQNHPPDYELFKYPGPALSNSTGALPVLNATTTGLLCDGNTNYPISLQVGTYGSGNAIAAWIDFNGDGTFNNYFDNLDKLCTGAAGTNTLTLTNISYQNGQHYNYGLEVGMSVYGTGIASGAKVTALTATTVTLSAANTGAVSGVITFKNEAPGKDRGEKVAQSGPLQSLQTLSTSFRVPTWAGSFAGKRRFRVREVWINYNIHPCNPATYGETEEYEIITIPDCAQYPGYKTWLGLTDEWENPVNWCPQGAPIQGSTQNTPCNLRFPGGPPSGATYAYSKAKIKTGVQARACKMWIAAGDTVFIDAVNSGDLVITDSLIIESATSALIVNAKKNDTIQPSNGTLRITNDQFLRPTQKNRSKWMYTYEEMHNLGLRAGDTIRTISINLIARNSNGNPYKNFKIKYYFAASNSNLASTPEPAVVTSFNGYTYPAAPITVFSGDVSVSAIPTGQPGVMAFTLSPGIVIPPGWSGSLCTGLIPNVSCALKMVLDMSYDHSGALPLTGDPYNPFLAAEDIRSTQTGNTMHFHTFSTSSAGIVASAETMLAANPINTITQSGATWVAGSTTINVGAIVAGLSVGMLAISPVALAGRYITNIAGTTITLNSATTNAQTNVSVSFVHRNPLSASIYRPNLTFGFKRPYIKYPITFSGPSWINNGTFKADSSVVTFNGAAGQKIEGTSNTNFYDLTISSPGHVLLNADISTTDTLRFISGRLKLNGRMLRHFNPAIGSIVSTATARIQPERDAIGTEVSPFSRFRWNMGTITGPRVLPFSNPAGANVDLTYDKITASGDTAVTFITYSTLATNANYPLPTVTNVNSAFWSGGTGVVDRFWSIQPTDSVNARANLTFRYATSEQLTSATSPINMQRWLYQPQFNVSCVAAGSTVQIVTAGTTNFTLMGAPNNNVGTVFTATGPGTGTGIIALITATGGWEASTTLCGGSFPVVGQVYTTGSPHSVQLNNYSGFNTSPWWAAVGLPQPMSENFSPTVFIFGDFDACQGDSATLTASAGFASYLWSTGATTQTIRPTAAGTYTVTATTSNGVTSTSFQSVTINSNPSPTISGNTLVCQNSSTLLSATAGFNNYSWNTGATSVSITITPSTTTSYTVTVTDNNGCTGSANTTVTVNPGPTPTITGLFNPCSGSAATLTASSGFNSYLWSDGATTQTINPTIAGTYTVTVTNGNGCTGTASQAVTITPNPSPSITGTFSVCQGFAATLTAGSGFTSYLWSTGASTQTINPTASGTYTVTVTNANGCTGSVSQAVVVNSNPTPAIGGNFAICQGSTSTLTASSGFNAYLWNTGATTASINTTTAGTFTVTVTDGNGCTGSTSQSVVVNPNPTTSITGTFNVCQGSAATLSAGSGFNAYLWNTGATTQTINPTTAATYTVTVTNSNGCTGTASQVVTITSNPVPNITGTFTVCQGNAATLTATSGYISYLWSTGATTQTINPTTAGNYTVTVTATGGCTGTQSQSVTVNTNPTPTITGTTIICQNNSTTLTATAGFSTYSWSTGATTAAITVTPSATNNYTVTVTNSNGCSGSASTSVTVNPRPTPIISGTFSVCSGNAATLTANATGVTSYLWNTGATTQTINPTTAGTYTVTATNSFGCTGTASQAVTITSSPVPNITGTFTVCQGNTATLTATAGYTSYLWNTGAVTQTINPSAAGTYTVTVTGTGGCTGSQSQAVTVNPLPTVSISGSSTVCQGSTVTWSATSGLTSYLWSTGATTASINVGTAGTYTVTATNSNGCANTSSKQLTVNPTSATTQNVNRCPGTSYTLPSGQTASVAGTYNSTLTNIYGCDSVVTTVLTFNDNIAPVASGCPAAFTTCNPATWTPPTFSDNCTFNVSSNFQPGVNLPLGNTTITYTATDAGGNSTVCSFIVTVVDFTLSTSQNNVTCFGQSNGSATVTATGTSGAVSYLWSNGATAATSTNLATGTYTVTVTNGNCSKQTSVTITQPAQFIASITPSGATTFCQGGSVTLTATAATSYLWNTGATTQSVTATTSGNYFATVTNASGCTSVTAPVTVTVNPNVIASVSIASSATGSVSPTTSVTFTATAINGGASPSFQWKKNGVNVGTNSNTYTNNAWVNLDVVTCVMTSNAVCVTGSPATSNAITVYVTTGGGGGSSTPRFVVSDVTANRVYYYDSTFTFIVSNPLSTTVLNGNTNASDVFMTATNGYILDGTANSRVYRSALSGTVSVASRQLRTNTGAGLNPTTGLIIRGDTLYVVDKKGKAIYYYSLSQSFNGATTTLNAFNKKTLLTANSTAEALSFDGTYFYVLDNGSSVKSIYRYPLVGTAAGVRSRPMKTNTGANLGTVRGIVIDGNTVWITDSGSDRAFPYDKTLLFTGSNTVNLNATTVMTLNSGNLNSTGISITNTSSLLRQELPLQNHLHVTVWPNPTSGVVNISLEGIDANERFTLRAYDMNGRLVAFREEAGTDTEFLPAFDLTGIKPGMYAIVVEQGILRKTVRVIVD